MGKSRRRRNAASRRRWARRWRESGQSAKAFAAEHGLALSSLSRWSSELREHEAAAATAGAFIEVIAATQRSPDGLRTTHFCGGRATSRAVVRPPSSHTSRRCFGLLIAKTAASRAPAMRQRLAGNGRRRVRVSRGGPASAKAADAVLARRLPVAGVSSRIGSHPLMAQQPPDGMPAQATRPRRRCPSQLRLVGLAEQTRPEQLTSAPRGHKVSALV